MVRYLAVFSILVSLAQPVLAAEMRRVGAFEIDVTEVTVGAFGDFVGATGTTTEAERSGDEPVG